VLLLVDAGRRRVAADRNVLLYIRASWRRAHLHVRIFVLTHA